MRKSNSVVAVVICVWMENTIISNGLSTGKSRKRISSFHRPKKSFFSSRKGNLVFDESYANKVPKDDFVFTASVDYSAVNEYVRAHYKISQYFDEDTVEHFMFDGRKLQSNYESAKANLHDHGLAIIKSSLKEIDWTQVQHIQSNYLPELEKIMHDLFSTSQILSYCFWNPMIRGESYEVTREKRHINTPTANIAPMVHIDTDVGAFDMNNLLDIIEKNKISNLVTTSSADEGISDVSSMEKVKDHILNKRKRFAILNFWRNIRDTPVSRSPLAILSTKYDDHNALSQSQLPCFPNARPNMKKSKWYIFPNATKDEVIVFYQYDRNAIQPSDLFHCAISEPLIDLVGMEKQSRKSFDVRALIVFDETVPEDQDRYSNDRTRPVLTFEQSGCFCDEQAEKIKQKI